MYRSDDRTALFNINFGAANPLPGGLVLENVSDMQSLQYQQIEKSNSSFVTDVLIIAETPGLACSAQLNWKRLGFPRRSP